jgi:hypothetical protein
MFRLFGHFIPVKMLTLLILEMAVLGSAVYYLLSTGIHSPRILTDLRGQLGRFSFLFAGAVGIAMISMGLYSRSAMSARRFSIRNSMKAQTPAPFGGSKPRSSGCSSFS